MKPNYDSSCAHEGENGHLVGAKTLLEELFPIEGERPSVRTLRKWQTQRLIPYKKIGGGVYFDVAEVRRAIDRNFSVECR